MNIDFKPKLFNVFKNYSKRDFSADLMAGIIVGIVALPLAIAFGIASGVSPEKGMITAIIGGIIVSLFGGSSVQIGGPTGAFIVIVYGIIANYGIEGLAIATFMAGIILLAMGIFKLGTMIKFIPYPIVIGFTAGIALTIFTTQIKDLFGMKIENLPADFISKWGVYFNAFSTTSLWTLLTGIATILIIISFPKISKKIPGSLAAIVIITVLCYYLRKYCGITSIETIGDRFVLSTALPKPHIASFNMETIIQLLPSSITIALLGSIESLLSATVADGVTGERHNSNTELMAQGAANIGSFIFGGIPVTGAIARTMTNIKNGGRTPVAGLIHAFVLLLILLFLSPLTKFIPMSCLAGVLIVVAYNMSEWRTIKSMIHNPKADVAVLFTTFALTVIFDLTVAIEVGLILAVILFMKRIMETTQISVIREELEINQEGEYPDELLKNPNIDKLTIPAGVEIYEIEGPFFFGVANKFDEIMREMGDEAKVRIIRMRKISFIDSTGIHNLEIFIKATQKESKHIILSGVTDNVYQTLSQAGIDTMIGENNICSNINLALDRAKEMLNSRP